MINPTHTILSILSIFGLHTRLSLNPEIAKEPSISSNTDARSEKHCAKIE